MSATNAAPEQTPETRARNLVARLTVEEKVSMLSGSVEFWWGMRQLLEHDYYHRHAFPAAVNERLGIEGLHFIDGPRGVVKIGGATTFPTTMARGATWNPELEERIGDALGKELRLLGGNLTGAVCINLLRHPAWGRAQETYGEDTRHLGVMGAALTRGIERHAIACVKHYALNSMENARFKVDVTVDDRALHEVYLPHFKDCVDAGARSIMSAYNSVNGEWAGQNRQLLTDILKDRWGFSGFVLTDFIFGVRDAKKAIENGLDLEMPFTMVWGPNLLDLVEQGTVDESLLDNALHRIVTAQLTLPPIDDYRPEWLGCGEHRALAREAATQAITLLKNDAVAGTPALPLPTEANVVVLGELAATAVLGDRGSSDGRPTYTVSALQGLRAASEGTVLHFDDLDATGAGDAVSRAEAVVVVVGNTHRDEGEFIAPASEMESLSHLFPPPSATRRVFANDRVKAVWPKVVNRVMGLAQAQQEKQLSKDGASFGRGGDRTSLRLKPSDEALIRRACEVHDRVIVALIGGSAIVIEGWREQANAIVMFWYNGQEGGNALADIVFGHRNPSGRLPFSIPTDEAHLPDFDKDATTATYDLWHGYRKLARDGNAAAFPFGYGLSYTSYEISNLTGDLDDQVVKLTATAANTGSVDGDLVVQFYVSVPDSAVVRAPRELKAFSRTSLQAGEQVEVSVEIPTSRLAYFDVAADDFVVEPTSYVFCAAQHCADMAAPTVTMTITE